MRRMMAFTKRMLGSLRGHKTQLALAVRLAVAAVAAYAIDAILAEERLVLEHEGRRAQWPGRHGPAHCRQ
jgi:hypothetical protein